MGAALIRRPTGLGVLAASVALGAAACELGELPARAAEGAGADFRITAAIEEVMRYIVDPAADSIWASVVTEVTRDGVISTRPETDSTWMALRGHALTLLEATNLLLMPGRPVAASGSRSEMPGVDLEPEQIEALLAEDRAAWAQFVGALYESATVVLDAVDRQDTEALLVAGDGLDLACENCHLRYWYPSLSDSTTPR